MHNYQRPIWVFNSRPVTTIILYSVHSAALTFSWLTKHIFNAKNSYLLKGSDIYIPGYFVGHFDLNHHDFLQ